LRQKIQNLSIGSAILHLQVSLEKVGYIAILAPIVKVGAVDLVELRKDLF